METRRPNILWIVTTQWRAAAFGYAGDVNASTPQLDRLASQAIHYTQAVTPHPFGPFARAALLTGRASPENGVRFYHDPLPRDQRTIAHELNARGYVTAFFGKWHLAPRDPDAPLVGEAHARTVVALEDRGGFRFWEGFEGGFQLNNPWLHGSRLRHPTQLAGYQSDVLVEWLLDWLREQTPAWLPRNAPPWFAVLSLEPPHPPYDAPLPEGIQLPDADELVLRDNVPRGGEAERRARRELAGYYGHIAATDRAIGRLLQNLPEDTIVVFTSVHGDMHGSQGCFRKGWPYEESVRVPLLARGVSGHGATEDASPVSLLNLPAMTCAWADGRTWNGAGSAAKLSMPSVVALRDQCDRIWHGERTPDRKRIYDEHGALWLEFDLRNDPFEQENRASRS